MSVYSGVSEVENRVGDWVKTLYKESEMGYRSEVMYRIVFNSEELMHLFIADAKSREDTKLVFEQEEEDNDDEVLKQVDDTANKYELRFHALHWKWYQEFEIVQAHEAIIELAREYDQRQDDKGKYIGGISYAFARIGEEMDDNDIFGSDDYWDLLQISRIIEMP